MICFLHDKQLQVLQNSQSSHWVSSTSLSANSSNQKILRKLNFSVRISYLLPTCQENLREDIPAKSIF